MCMYVRVCVHVHESCSLIGWCRDAEQGDAPVCMWSPREGHCLPRHCPLELYIIHRDVCSGQIVSGQPNEHSCAVFDVVPGAVLGSQKQAKVIRCPVCMGIILWCGRHNSEMGQSVFIHSLRKCLLSARQRSSREMEQDS